MVVVVKPRSQGEDEVVRVLDQHNFTVLFSGGKDSTAALLWILDHVNHRNWNVLYVEVTGNTHSLCIEYAVKLCESLDLGERMIVAKSNQNFYELMDRWGPPLLFAYRWCLYRMKLKLFDKYAHYFTVDGIRRSDSKIRRNIKLIQIMKIAKRISVSPLATWSRKDVLDYIKDHGVQLNPCYRLYSHSGNCMFCPYADSKHIMLTLQDPEWRNKILSALSKAKDRLAKGSIGKSVYHRWMKWANQTSIDKFS
jgi:3'-phosphoadenosine 5'-phosphosulfate sulfotransferase (PAPS reductase)/FAD synthetase